MNSILLLLLVALDAEPESIDLPQPSDATQFRSALTSVDKHLAALARSVDELLPRATELASALRAAENSFSTADDAKLQDKFPATQLFSTYAGTYRFEGFETDPAKLKARMTEAADAIAALRRCAASLLKSVSPAPAECTHLLGCDRDIGWDADGLFRYEVARGYSVRKTRLRQPGDFVETGATDGKSKAATQLRTEIGGVMLDECRLVSLLKPPREPSSIALKWKHYEPFFSTTAQFRASCSSDPREAPEMQTLASLAQRFPDSKDISAALEEPTTNCSAAASVRCVNVDAAARPPSISFVDGQCRLRNATADELRRDSFKLGSKEEQEKASAQLELLEACASARAAGFSWESQAPKPPSPCMASADRVAPSDVQETEQNPPPAPETDSEFDFKPVPRSELAKTTKLESWSNYGWMRFRWGMGPADALPLLQEKNGDFQAFQPPDCTSSPDLPFEFGCYVNWEDHVFRLLDVAPSLTLDFTDTGLFMISLDFRDFDSADAMRAKANELQKLLTKKYGTPIYYRIPPLADNEGWTADVEWKTPTTEVRLSMVAVPRKSVLRIVYSDTDRAAELLKRSSEERQKKDGVREPPK